MLLALIRTSPAPDLPGPINPVSVFVGRLPAGSYTALAEPHSAFAIVSFQSAIYKPCSPCLHADMALSLSRWPSPD